MSGGRRYWAGWHFWTTFSYDEDGRKCVKSRRAYYYGVRMPWNLACLITHREARP